MKKKFKKHRLSDVTKDISLVHNDTDMVILATKIKHLDNLANNIANDIIEDSLLHNQHTYTPEDIKRMAISTLEQNNHTDILEEIYVTLLTIAIIKELSIKHDYR
jgi:hypothetical protein